MPRISPPLDGVLLVDKPSGLTSHDVVDRVRRHFRFEKVGHCGTLDPMATGLLALVLGRATKLQAQFMGDDKTYIGTIRLGIATDSGDADGEIVAEKPVPEISREQIEAAFAKFRGDLLQKPPMVSAIKHKGQPLYKLARKGVEVEREPRLVHIYDFRPTKIELPNIEFTATCSKGTYLRVLAADLGEIFGCGAHLSALRRTKSGHFSVENAQPLENLLQLSLDNLQKIVIPLAQLPKIA
jgi:tRNA pseudouridine55 synthase